jgi:hypothetical protein
MPQHPDGESQLPVAPAGASAAPPPPPRPGLSYSRPAPILVVPPAPGSIILARTFWLVSFVAGLAVIVGSFLTRDSHLERLRTVVDQMAPGGDANAVTTATGVVFWGSLSALVLMMVLQASLLAAVSARRGWARWLLILLLAGQAGVMAMAAAFLVPEGDAGSYVVLLWGAQLLLAFIGVLMLLLPSASRWFKSRKNQPLGFTPAN